MSILSNAPTNDLRFMAMVVDFFVHFMPLYLVFKVPIAFAVDWQADWLLNIAPLLWFVYIVLFVAFYSACESVYGGSIGKLAFKMKVVDELGRPISFARAIGRSAARLISMSMLWLGCFIFFFNKRKQNLHCMISKTFVVMNENESEIQED